MTRLALLVAVLAVAGCSPETKPTTSTPGAPPAKPSTDPNMRDDSKRGGMTPTAPTLPVNTDKK